MKLQVKYNEKEKNPNLVWNQMRNKNSNVIYYFYCFTKQNQNLLTKLILADPQTIHKTQTARDLS